jgi:hypothetical protein
LEILDNARERQPLRLYEPGERIHIVIEVADIAAARSRLAISAPEPEAVSWGAKALSPSRPRWRTCYLLAVGSGSTGTQERFAMKNIIVGISGPTHLQTRSPTLYKEHLQKVPVLTDGLDVSLSAK